MKIVVSNTELRKSFSSEIGKKNPGAKWVTLQNGTHVMIREGSDGKARIVFSGNANMEHLELDRTESKAESENSESLYDKKIEGMDADKLKQFNTYRKEKTKQKAQIQEKYVEKMNNILGIDLMEKKDKDKKETGNKTVDDLNKEIDKLSKADKKKVKEVIQNIATEKATNGILKETTGSTYADLFGSSPLKTGIESIDSKLDKLEMTNEQALAVLNASQTYLEQQKDLDKAYKVAMKKPEKFLETIQNLSDVGITDDLSESEVVNDVVSRLLDQKAVQDRIERNMTYYDLVDTRKNRESLKLQNESASESFNALLGLSGSEYRVSKELVNLIGIKNTSKLIASALDKDQSEKLAKVVQVKSEKLVSETIDKTNKTLENIKNLESKTKEGTLYASSFATLKMKSYREMGRDLSVSSGSLNAGAELYNAFQNKQDVISLTIPKNKTNEFLEKIDAKGASIIESGENNIIRLNKNDIGNILTKQKVKSKRDDFVKMAKNGGLVQPDYKVPFAVDSLSILPAQQEGIKWAMHQKRTVLDFGAGLGKTITYLGIVGELKQQGKLKDSFAVIAVPSRLRDEFFNDQKKFFPDLKILNIDKIDKSLSLKDKKSMFPNTDENILKNATTKELKQIALESAKSGNYDMVLSGHDTLKNSETTDLIQSYSPAAFIVDEAHEVVNSDNGEDMQRYKAVRNIASKSEYFTAGTGTLIKNNLGELGKMLNIAQPDNFVSPKAFADKWNSKINKSSNLFHENTINNFRKTFDNIILSRTSDVSYLDKEGNVKKPKKIKNTINVELSNTQNKQYKDIEGQYKQEKLNKGKFGLLNKETGMLEKVGDNLVSYDKRPKNKDNSKTHQIIELGGQDSANRRDFLHRKNLYGGDYKNNAKLMAIVNDIKNSSADSKHIIYYDTMSTQYSKPALIQAMKEGLGYSDEQIAMIDGSVKIGKTRNEQKNKFNEGAGVKVMMFNSAGATGLNLQSADKVHLLARPNTFAEQEQIEARAFRKGRKSDVQINYYDSDTLFDKTKVDSIERKKKLTKTLGEYQENPTLEKLYGEYLK